MAAFVPIRNKGKFVKRATLIRSQNGRKQGIARNRIKELNEHTDHTYSKTEEEVLVEEMDIGLELEVDNERNEDWKNGRRVVELEKMAKEMFCDICNQWLHLKDTVKESRYGLGSVLRVKCSACGSVKKLNLGKTNDDGGFDVNRKAVIAMYKAGMGPANLRAFLAEVNLPPIDQKTIRKIEKKLGPVIIAKAKASCDRARREEQRRARGKVECSFDAAWQTRGTGSQYNSNTGHASLIGKATGKVLDFDLRSKVCRVCDYHSRRKEEIPDHDCCKNWHGSSKAMEADMASTMLHELHDLGTEVKAFHADNDSSTAARLKVEFAEIEKKDDQNHLKKGISKRLHTMATTHKELKGAGVIEYLVRCFMYAITGSDESCDSLRTALGRIVPHVFGDHTLCEEAEWCSFHKNPEDFKYSSLPNGKPFTNAGLRKDLEEMVEAYKKRAPNLQGLGSTQANESFNHMVACKAPKNKFYGGSSSLSNRLAAATLEKNEGNTWPEEVHTAVSLSPGYYSKKLGEKLDKKREYYKQRSRTIAFKRRRIALKKKRKLNDKTNYFREGTQYSSNMELQEDNDSEFIPVPAQIDNSDNIVVFDIETTGLSRNSDIVQIAATDREKTFNCFIAPRQPICAAASAITGLTFSEGNNQLYKNGKRVDCTTIHKGLLDFMAFLKSFRKPVLVGHNIISFDIPVLYNRLQEFQLCQAFMALVKGCIDTLKIARRTFTKAEVGNHKQETLVKKLLKKSYNAHDAQEDVNLLFELFTKKLDNYGAEDLYAFNYHAVLNSYKEMTSKKVVSVRSSQILAQAGIGLNHLRLAHKRDEKNGIRIILKENHVPVKSIDLIIEHLSSEE